MNPFLRALPVVVLFATACSVSASTPGNPSTAASDTDVVVATPAPGAAAAPDDDPGGSPPATSPSPAMSSSTTSARLADLETPDRSLPARIRIASLDVDASVVGVGVTDGELDVLDDVVNVGWYRYGPTPGEPGSAVLAAHVDTARDGPGVFFELGTLEPGDRIDVDLVDGTPLSFFVESVERHPKADLPADELFSRDGGPRIALITCGGAFDRAAGRYADNVVVVARP